MSDSPTLTIRGQRSDDWVDLFTWWSDGDLLRNSVNLPYSSEDSFREAVNTILANEHVLMAEMSALSGRKQVVGMTRLTVNQRPRRRHCGEIVLAIRPDLHGTDVGPALLNKILDLADNWLGLRRLETIVYVDDAHRLALYEQQDFVQEITLRRYAFGDGHYNDAVLLARLRGI